MSFSIGCLRISCHALTFFRSGTLSYTYYMNYKPYHNVIRPYLFGNTDLPFTAQIFCDPNINNQFMFCSLGPLTNEIGIEHFAWHANHEVHLCLLQCDVLINIFMVYASIKQFDKRKNPNLYYYWTYFSSAYLEFFSRERMENFLAYSSMGVNVPHPQTSHFIKYFFQFDKTFDYNRSTFIITIIYIYYYG